ncbi:Centrosomal protein of 192 kDa [Vulpes lagopus]
MTARDRAMVVEHCIKVAKACQILQNYSSMPAILCSAACVNAPPEEHMGQSFQSFQQFQKLRTEDNPQSRKTAYPVNLTVLENMVAMFLWMFYQLKVLKIPHFFHKPFAHLKKIVKVKIRENLTRKELLTHLASSSFGILSPKTDPCVNRLAKPMTKPPSTKVEMRNKTATCPATEPGDTSDVVSQENFLELENHGNTEVEWHPSVISSSTLCQVVFEEKAVLPHHELHPKDDCSQRGEAADGERSQWEVLELMTVEMFSELPMQHSHVLLFLVYWKAEEFRSFLVLEGNVRWNLQSPWYYSAQWFQVSITFLPRDRGDCAQFWGIECHPLKEPHRKHISEISTVWASDVKAENEPESSKISTNLLIKLDNLVKPRRQGVSDAALIPRRLQDFSGGWELRALRTA